MTHVGGLQMILFILKEKFRECSPGFRAAMLPNTVHVRMQQRESSCGVQPIKQQDADPMTNYHKKQIYDANELL